VAATTLEWFGTATFRVRHAGLHLFFDAYLDLDGLRPDVALLSLGGRSNVDGEPFQGSSAAFMLGQVQRLGAGRVAFCHHDPLFPGLPGVDVGPAAAALREAGPAGSYFALEYATPVPILG
jgi:hypothetical protein